MTRQSKFRRASDEAVFSMTKFSILALAILLISMVARADIAPDPMSGGISLQVTGREKTDIALRHNTVKIGVTPTLCTTKAFFRLKNLGKPTQLEVGFPLSYEGESANFQLFIDNKTAEFKDKTEKYTGPYGFERERYWKAWDMSFAASETHLVEVRYSNPPSEGYSTNLKEFGRYPFYQNWIATEFDYDVADYGYARSEQLSDWVKVRMMDYILVSGSYWRGPIERCHVEADIAAVSTDAIIDVFPPAQEMSPEKIAWHWENVEPSRNVRFVFLKHSPERVILPFLKSISKDNPDDESVEETFQWMRDDFGAGNKTRLLQQRIREGQKQREKTAL